MKSLTFLIGLMITAAVAKGQDYVGQDYVEFTNLPATHIQTANEMYQNNSQFTNKDNKFDNSKPYLTSNGTYWVPGYSNPANRGNTENGMAPNTSVNPVQSDVINYYIQENLNTETGNAVIIPRQVVNRSYSDGNNW